MMRIFNWNCNYVKCYPKKKKSILLIYKIVSPKKKVLISNILNVVNSKLMETFFRFKYLHNLQFYSWPIKPKNIYSCLLDKICFSLPVGCNLKIGTSEY